MFIYENLLRNEYFPSELPPCFNTESLADNFEEIKKILLDVHFNISSVPLTFSGYKNKNARRKFAIPNPYHYYKAVEAIVNNSEEIFNIFDKSKSSLTRPMKSNPKKNESYHRLSNSIAESKQIIEQLYQNNLYEIRLDIASFFDSIYTHSVPWAIHTKATAKQNKKDELYGNVLDSCLQAMNYSQTNGVLVGNAVSRIISEIILCTVDESINKRLPNIIYKRYVDDYYIYAKDSSEISNILAVFRQELAKYELALNENKIQICESPFIYGKPWVEQMKEYLHLKPNIFLNKAIIEYNKYKDISILKYGLKVIQFQKFSSAEWKSIQSILINIWVKFPSLSNIFTSIFKCNEKQIRRSLLKNAIYSILENNLNLNNDQEVIWAVWIAKVFNIEMSQLYIHKVLNSDNWLAIIIMLDIIKRKKMKNKPTIMRYLENLYDCIEAEFFDSAGGSQNLMWSELWLLAYEADKNKWLNISDKKSFMFARKNEFFKKLRELDVGFYNSEYQYVLPENEVKRDIYITRQEFNEIIKKLQKSINSRASDREKLVIDFTDDERGLIETIHNVVNPGDY